MLICSVCGADYQPEHALGHYQLFPHTQPTKDRCLECNTAAEEEARRTKQRARDAQEKRRREAFPGAYR